MREICLSAKQVQNMHLSRQLQMRSHVSGLVFIPFLRGVLLELVYPVSTCALQHCCRSLERCNVLLLVLDAMNCCVSRGCGLRYI